MNTIIQEDHYLHRDINWLSFNYRVLQEAKDDRNPIFERIKFLGIFSSNLDEFFRVRVSNLRQLKKIDRETRKTLRLKPNKTLKIILKKIIEQQEEFGSIFKNEILPELQRNSIFLTKSEDFTSEMLPFIKEVFEGYSSSVEIIKTIETPHLEDGTLYYSVLLDNEEICFVKIPSEQRFYKLPETKQGKYHITLIDDIIAFHLPSLFPDRDIIEVGEIKLSRDAELYLEEDYEGGLAQQIYEALSQRKMGQPTRMLFDASISKVHRNLLKKILGLGKVDLMPGGKYHNFSDFMKLENPTDDSTLVYDPKPALVHPVLSKASCLFKTIAKSDQLVHFPYQQFDYVAQLLEQAATDPLVKTIKISLYRIAKESALNNALLLAIENGKEVTIFIEAQARFDEANNIEWGQTFSDKGANVIYSIPNIKVHSKIFLIQRLENENLQNYAFISTGNFNANTAKVYVDHGLFTANSKITDELVQVFEVLERKLIIPKTKHLLVSPFNTRSQFELLIENEITHALEGKKAKITAKMNSLHDKHIIKKLYEASQAGVEIRLLIRGFCCLVPETEGLSDHIYITSIVDRYLEHGRIYVFENGGKEIMYMGSADWMTRNLDHRIEVLTPIYDKAIFKELKKILSLQLKDNQKARHLDAAFKNKYIKPKKNETQIRSQYAIYDYLSNKLK